MQEGQLAGGRKTSEEISFGRDVVNEGQKEGAGEGPEPPLQSEMRKGGVQRAAARPFRGRFY